MVTPAIMSFFRPVALTAAAKFSSSIAFTMPIRFTRAANSAGRIDSNSLNSGPCAYSSMLEVSTTGILRIFAVLASISALRFSSSYGIDLAQPMVPT
ncbi:hypothetical protein D3C71_1731150 [compost metagenome]